MRRMILALAVTALTLPLHAANLKIEDPWARATAPGQPVGGVFMKLTSDSNAELIGASSPVAGMTQIHMMKMQDGVMIMREMKSLPLPKGKIVELAPGGYHIMLMDLKQPLKAGVSVPVTLKVQSRNGIRKVEVKAEVRDMISGEEGHHH